MASVDSAAFSCATEVENAMCLGTFSREYLLGLEIAQKFCLPFLIYCSAGISKIVKVLATRLLSV